jgi:pre-rRNA-processing protein TSR3
LSSLAKFSWGHGFYKMNSHLIERYRKCHTSEEIQAEQEKIQAEMEEESRQRKAAKGR